MMFPIDSKMFLSVVSFCSMTSTDDKISFIVIGAGAGAGGAVIIVPEISTMGVPEISVMGVPEMSTTGLSVLIYTFL